MGVEPLPSTTLDETRKPSIISPRQCARAIKGQCSDRRMFAIEDKKLN